MVVVKFLVFVSEVVSIFSKIRTWIIGGEQKNTFAPPTQLLGARAPASPLRLRLCLCIGFEWRFRYLKITIMIGKELV